MYKQNETIELEGDLLFIAVKAEKKELIDKILESEKIQVKELVWQSKYNQYVAYNYEPLCTEGFILNYVISGNKNKLKFLKTIITKTIDKINFLEKCLNMQSAKAIV